MVVWVLVKIYFCIEFSTFSLAHFVSLRIMAKTIFQVGSTTLHRDHRNRPILLISQPGGSFLKVRVPEGRPTAVFDDPIDDDEDDETCRIIRSFEPLVISNIRNCYVTTEILGEFSVGASSSSTVMKEFQKKLFIAQVLIFDCKSRNGRSVISSVGLQLRFDSR